MYYVLEYVLTERSTIERGYEKFTVRVRESNERGGMTDPSRI